MFDTKGRALITQSRRVRVTRLWAGLATLAVASATFAVAAPAASASGSNTLTIKAGEYVYQLKGSLKSGWSQIDFQNAGVENHMLAVVQLKKGVTVKQLKAAATSSDNNAFTAIAAPGANPNGVAGFPTVLGPGQKTSTMTQLKAGHYGIMCFIPAASDGKPHVAHGMLKVFDVSTAKSSLKPPTDGVADVTLSDTAITVPPGNPGRQLTAKITNAGSAGHTFDLVKISDGKTLDDVNAYFNAFFSGQKPAGDAPGTIVGGIGEIDAGTTAYLVQTLKPGHYGYASTDGTAPNDDYGKGMKGEFDVK